MLKAKVVKIKRPRVRLNKREKKVPAKVVKKSLNSTPMASQS